MRCLGDDNWGLIGLVTVAALAVPVITDFGLDIVAVRHVVAKTARLGEVTPALLCVRLAATALLGVVWVIAAMVILPRGMERQVWLWGAPYMAAVSVGYAFYFQAVGRVPVMAFGQAALGLASAGIIALSFYPGVSPAYYMQVLTVLTAGVSLGLWCWVGRRATSNPAP